MTLLRMTISRSIHGATNGIISLFVVADASVDGHLGCLHVLAVVSSAVVNVGVHVSFQIMIFSRYMSRTRIAGSSVD